MAITNPTAAITRALKEAAKLSRADLDRVIYDLASSEKPSAALLSMAYVANVYHEIAGEDRRYLTAKLKSIRDAAAATPAAAPEGTTPQ